MTSNRLTLKYFLLSCFFLFGCNDKPAPLAKGRMEIFAVDWSETRSALTSQDILEVATEHVIIKDINFIENTNNEIQKLKQFDSLHYDAKIVCLIYSDTKVDTLSFSRGRNIRYNSVSFLENKDLYQLISSKLSLSDN